MSVSQVTLYHLLKLFQSDSNAMPKKTVVSEFYDEMVCLLSGFYLYLLMYCIYSFPPNDFSICFSSMWNRYFDITSLTWEIFDLGVV